MSEEYTLLNGLTLGNWKPSELLRVMLRLAALTNMHEALLRELWLQRLPQTVQAIIIAIPNLNLEDAATAADAVHERLLPHETTTPSYPLATVGDKEIESLRAILAQFSTSVRKTRQPVTLDYSHRRLTDLQQRITRCRSPSRSPRRRSRTSRYRTNSPELDSKGICWYHRHFGVDARNCKPGCVY